MERDSEELDDCNIQEETLNEANDTHWEVHDSAVDESTIALMMKTVTITGVKDMKRSMQSRKNFRIC